MTDFIRVTDNFYVSPQIGIEDVARAAREGFTLLINNRPDGEAPGQPTHEEIRPPPPPSACTAPISR
jgi:uncharacterized protein (TIGR01244 family)